MRIFQHTLISALILFGCSIITYAQPIDLPDIGDSAASVMTPEQEHRTGQAIIRNIRRAGGILDDPLATDYINQLGYELVSHSQANHKDFNFFIINDPAINAFALPGGYIGINYGLILATHSESELASVVAHEIAHVTQRHHARAYDLASDNNIPVVAALIAAIVLGSNNSELGEAAMASLAAGTMQKQIDFTRENEKEADHIGIGLLSDSGFDPFSMGDFFDALQRESRLYGPQAPEFLRTHPVNENRVAEARSRATQYPRARLQNEFNYYLAKSRLRTLTSKDDAAVRDVFAANLKNGRYSNKSAEQYGYALMLIKHGQFSKAQDIIQTLLREDPQRIPYQLAYAQANKQAGNNNKAIAIYKEALAINPGNEAVTLPYATTLIEMGQAQKAIDTITPLLHERIPHPEFYRLLARAESQLKHEANQHEAMAEYYFQTGLTHQAITQLDLALKDKSADFYQRSRIEARRHFFKDELLNNQNG